MRAELADDFLARAVVVDETHVGRAELDVRDVLGDVSADAAVYLLDIPDVSALRNILVHGESLDIHKDGSDDNNTHS